MFRKFLKKLALNKKGSETVEKIFMVVVALAMSAFAAAYITQAVSNATKGDAGNHESTASSPVSR